MCVFLRDIRIEFIRASLFGAGSYFKPGEEKEILISLVKPWGRFMLDYYYHPCHDYYDHPCHRVITIDIIPIYASLLLLSSL